jgi:hypothetical protein
LDELTTILERQRFKCTSGYGRRREFEPENSGVKGGIVGEKPVQEFTYEEEGS